MQTENFSKQPAILQPVLNKFNPVHTRILFYIHIHFNIILPYMSRSTRQYLPSVFKAYLISLVLAKCPSRLNHPNDVWAYSQITNLHTVKFVSIILEFPFLSAIPQCFQYLRDFPSIYFPTYKWFSSPEHFSSFIKKKLIRKESDN
jgi:hypothetical protein